MAEKLLMTALSPTMEEGTIVSWSKKVGETITSGDPVCEVETDKATMDYEAVQEGVLLKIIVNDGESAKVGEAIGIIGEEGEDIDDLVKEIEAGGKTGKKAEEPDATDSRDASDAGDTSGKPDRGRAAPPASGSGDRIKASPLARKLADEKGLDLSAISGSGPGGRIVKRDLESAAAAGTGAQERGPKAHVAAAGADESFPVTGKRAVIARRLAESKFSAPHYYLKLSAEMQTVIEARTALNASRRGDKVSFNAFMIKFAAEALKRHPDVNASWQGDKIVRFGSIDIGLAVDLGGGLITPIVRNCGAKGVERIDSELQELIEKVSKASLKPEEYSGATFTISNLGSFGVEEFTAIINPPGAAILALGETKKQPVVRGDDEIAIVPVMKMTLSCDHRVIDGAVGARFLAELKSLMENPYRLLF